MTCTSREVSKGIADAHGGDALVIGEELCVFVGSSHYSLESKFRFGGFADLVIGIETCGVREVPAAIMIHVIGQIRGEFLVSELIMNSNREGLINPNLRTDPELMRNI